MEALFLDQNKWIELACVRTGAVSSGPSYIAYAELHEAVDRGRVVAPLTIATFLKHPAQRSGSRTHVAEVQASLSKGFVFRSRKARLLIEIRNALHSAFGEPRVQLEPNWSILPGFFMQAFEPLRYARCESTAQTARIFRLVRPKPWCNPKVGIASRPCMLHQDDEHPKPESFHAKFSCCRSDALVLPESKGVVR